MNNELMFSSETGMWSTPRDFYAHVDRLFGPFTLDAAATLEDTCCKYFISKEADALADSIYWPGVVWLNPPYGRGIGAWVEKAKMETQDPSGKASRVVCLIPARTDTLWWNDHVIKANIILFIKGRLKFGNATASAPFPSALAIFDRSPSPTLPKARGRKSKINRRVGTITRDGEIDIIAGPKLKGV